MEHAQRRRVAQTGRGPPGSPSFHVLRNVVSTAFTPAGGPHVEPVPNDNAQPPLGDARAPGWRASDLSSPGVSPPHTTPVHEAAKKRPVTLEILHRAPGAESPPLEGFFLVR